jgi:tetratricopeptide (TPR) repeat protein
MTQFKVRSALAKHQKGDKEAAFDQYGQLYGEGVLAASYMLPYSVLLLRRGGEENYKKVKEVLVKAQKAPDLTPDKRQQLLMNYSVSCWKLGEKDKAISTLEASHRKAPNGLTYQTLGFLYVEYGDTEKALAYNLEALEYDDEDSIVLDNLGQTYYRLLDDKAKAKPYFEKALEKKPGQIDTLYFLSRYDLENGDKEEAIRKLETALDGNFSPLNIKTRDEIAEEIERIRRQG